MQHTVIPRSFLKSGEGGPHPPDHGPLGQSAPGHQAVPVAQQVVVLRSELATGEASDTESHIVVSKIRRWNVVW